MTREEAVKVIESEFGAAATRGWFDRWINTWEKLGVLKFDIPKTPAQELQVKLRDLMVEIEYRPFQEKGVEKSGRLTPYGAGCIVNYIEQCGFELVKAKR